MYTVTAWYSGCEHNFILCPYPGSSTRAPSVDVTVSCLKTVISLHNGHFSNQEPPAVVHFHNDDIWLQQPEFISFFAFLFKFVNPVED